MILYYFYRCDQNVTNDYIQVSNTMGVDPIYRRFCGNRIPQAVVSEKNFFRLTFVTGNANNGTGFSGRYEFRERDVYMADELNSAVHSKSKKKFLKACEKCVRCNFGIFYSSGWVALLLVSLLATYASTLSSRFPVGYVSSCGIHSGANANRRL